MISKNELANDILSEVDTNSDSDIKQFDYSILLSLVLSIVKYLIQNYLNKPNVDPAKALDLGWLSKVLLKWNLKSAVKADNPRVKGKGLDKLVDEAMDKALDRLKQLTNEEAVLLYKSR